MKPGQFVYHAPRTIDEAVAMLAAVAPEDGRVIAGGQSLVPAMALRMAHPAHLVDINGVAGLDRLEVEAGELCIGACVRHAPRTIDEAVAMLAAVAREDGRVIAGGQSLVPAMALRMAQPAHLVDINGVAGLDRLEVEAGELCIGACVRHAAFARSVVDGPLGPLLSSVARHIAHLPIRTRGTFCGSIANADPASEWCLVVATLGANMVVRSARGSRTVAEPGFFQGIMTTALAPDELLAETRLPVLAADTRCGFNEFNRRAGDFAIAMSLAAYRIEGGLIVDPRVGVGAVESQPRRIPEAEAALRGQAPGAECFRAAAQAAADAMKPIDAKPELAAYKRDVVRAVVRRALEAAEQSA